MTDGVYVGVKYNGRSMGNLHRFAREIQVPNPVPKGMLHSTVLYCTERTEAPHIREVVNFTALPWYLEVWPTESGNVLVLVLDSPGIQRRHEEWLSRGYPHAYDNFVPHVTLSYDVGDWRPDGKPINIPALEANLVYVEPLKLDWGK